MAEIIKMPRLSDTMTDGVVVKWHKKIGDKIDSDVTPIAFPITELPSKPKNPFSSEFNFTQALGLLPQD